MMTGGPHKHVLHNSLILAFSVWIRSQGKKRSGLQKSGYQFQGFGCQGSFTTCSTNTGLKIDFTPLKPVTWRAQRPAYIIRPRTDVTEDAALGLTHDCTRHPTMTVAPCRQVVHPSMAHLAGSHGETSSGHIRQLASPQPGSTGPDRLGPKAPPGRSAG